MALDPAQPESTSPASSRASQPPEVSESPESPEYADRHRADDRPGSAPDGQWVRAEELHPLLMAMNSLCDGDFTVRVEGTGEGFLAEMAGVFNRIVARNEHLATEVQRVRREVVRQGRLDERITASPGQGAWSTSVDAANT